MDSKVCSKTSSNEFPHHWDCIYIDDGHPGCTCEPDSHHCLAYECTITDKSRRVPDGSCVCREEIKKSRMFVAAHNFAAGSVEVIPLN